MDSWLKLRTEFKAYNEYNYISNLLQNIADPIIKLRVENLLIWYVRKAHTNKYCYLVLSTIILIFNYAIPVINLTGTVNIKDIIVSLIASLSGLLTGVITLVRFHDNWSRYRSFSEMMKKECMNYISKSADYDQVNADRLFIERIEKIASEEVGKWEEIYSDNSN